MEPTRPSRLLYMPWKVVSAVPVTPGGLALVGGAFPERLMRRLSFG